MVILSQLCLCLYPPPYKASQPLITLRRTHENAIKNVHLPAQLFHSELRVSFIYIHKQWNLFLTIVVENVEPKGASGRKQKQSKEIIFNTQKGLTR